MLLLGHNKFSLNNAQYQFQEQECCLPTLDVSSLKDLPIATENQFYCDI